MCLSAVIRAEATNNKADIPALVEAADVPPDFTKIKLVAWNADPMTVFVVKIKLIPTGQVRMNPNST